MNFKVVGFSLLSVLFFIGLFYMGYDHYHRLEVKCGSHGMSVSSGHPDLCVNTQTGQLYAPQYLK